MNKLGSRARRLPSLWLVLASHIAVAACVLPAVEEGSSAVPASDVDASSHVPPDAPSEPAERSYPASAESDRCASQNGGCDVSPLATCVRHVGAAPSCECPPGTEGSGVGNDGCTPSVQEESGHTPCGEFLCDDETVKDPNTGLTWQRVIPRLYEGCTGKYVGDRGAPGATCALVDAQNYCAGLTLESDAYRLPTVDELMSIVDNTRTNPAIDPSAFPNTPPIFFWSPSQQDTSGNVSGVHFNLGVSYKNQFTAPAAVRCVH